VRIWLYEDTRMFMEGIIIGFDEYMNVVLDDAVEMDTKKNSRLPVGRCLLKGDSITLIQYVYIDTHSCVYEHTRVCVYMFWPREIAHVRDQMVRCYYVSHMPLQNTVQSILHQQGSTAHAASRRGGRGTIDHKSCITRT
jgi:small nuclear ribonucleoprotein (snRNP)-like protein